VKKEQNEGESLRRLKPAVGCNASKRRSFRILKAIRLECDTVSTVDATYCRIVVTGRITV
jgi:hypothetical protein